MREVVVTNAHPRVRVPRQIVTDAVGAVLRGERVSRAAVSVVLIDTRRCVRINREFLGHDYTTDVISFPLEEGPNLEGEIYVNIDKARAQAREFGVTLTNEVIRLVVHGTLHLTGYDDRRAKDAARMKAREDAYVRRLEGKRETRRE